MMYYLTVDVATDLLSSSLFDPAVTPAAAAAAENDLHRPRDDLDNVSDMSTSCDAAPLNRSSSSRPPCNDNDDPRVSQCSESCDEEDDDEVDITEGDRPLFTPPPSTDDECAQGGSSSCCSSTMGGCVAPGQVYDFAAAKRQYVLSFIPMTGSSLDCSTTSSNDELGGRRRNSGGSLTVGRNAGGLTTWRQVQGGPKNDPGGSNLLTTWQRLKTSKHRPQRRSNPTPATTLEGSQEIVESSGGSKESPGGSRSLLQLYQRGGTPPSPSSRRRYGTPVSEVVMTRSRPAGFEPPTTAEKSIQCVVTTGLIDKAVQTSLVVEVEDRRERVSMARSAQMILSRPLPDLEFLKYRTVVKDVSRSNNSDQKVFPFLFVFIYYCS